jgi:phospholipase D1/2
MEHPAEIRIIPQDEEADRPTDLATAANGGLSRKQTRDLGTATPRRSVQFARSGTFDSDKVPSEQQGHSRQESWGANEDQAQKGGDKEKLGAQLMSKLKAITTTGHSRSLSGWSIGGFGSDDKAVANSPGNDGAVEGRYAGYDADADAEESAAEGSGAGPSKPKRKRKFRRDADEAPSTAPTTPRATRLPPFAPDFGDRTPPASAPPNRPTFLPRRATMNDIPEHQRVAMSEDEGRDRLAGEGFLRRGSNWVSGHRGLTESTSRVPQSSGEGSEPKRPAGLRMLTSFGGRDADGSPSPWRQRQERATSMGQQRWRQLKAGLKMLGARKKEEATRVEAVKSAELMAELLAGAPAALIFASMFQRDERGHKRVPVLLEQLRLKVTDSERDDEDKHAIFRIELEYGSSLARMKWVIKRDLQDFAKLHVRYKAEENVEKYRHPTRRSERSKLPKFPRSAFPGFVGDFFSTRGLKLDESDEEQEDQTAGEQSGLDGEASGTERPGRAGRRRRSSFQLTRKKSSRFGMTDSTVGTGLSFKRIETVPERQRRKLEEYLHKLITYVMFGRNSNRLCAFLELSALGVRLASEGYHGKEGPLSIRSTRGVDYKPLYKRSLKQLNQLAFTAGSKWFLVRQSYLVCVDSLEEMNVYDVILLDPEFSVERKRTGKKRDETAKELARRAGDAARHPTHHQLRIRNTERLWKLTGRSEHIAAQFEESIKFIASQSEWAKPHRYDSFAPVRHNVWAQFLVDGRDYMWNVSRALDMARDVIYIHDWWLSPQLYMRRPAAISQRWRLDRILARKAAEGVKIYVIMYRNINTAIPIDSEFSKFSLLALNPEGKNNVFVQRSPNQFRQNTFFWAHHEKVCIVDHCVAFCGGVDLCFGRWDLPSHPVVDDKPTGFEVDESIPRDAENCQLWPGKDYSNPRVQDFFRLDQPYEEMYDREKIPRMPWHDIGMQMVGQPARDLSRHFVQRWNFLLRQRTPSRPTPFLLPPTDFIPADLEALELEGTCEVQILRSASSWSIGTPGPERDEHSIMNAYVDMIQKSDHFVYMENQFFITSCEISNTKIENKIGDALVERIIRAHENEEWWRACIVIPLMPGFQNAVDAPDGSSVRIIMECQYRSICRGPTSIFGRLRARGIEPEDYIEFYALRSHGKIGPTKALVTEQLYIHAKVMVVDDRVAIIGSANINERSMLGSRDSEIAAIVRDRDLIPSRMAGQDYMVARFAHGLRMRLMREHLGLDIDQIRDDELESAQVEHEMHGVNGKRKAHSHSHGLGDDDEDDAESVGSLDSDRIVEQKLIDNRYRAQEELIAKQETLHSFNHDVDWTQANNPHIKTTKKRTQDARINKNEEFRKDLLGMGADKMLQHDVNENDQEARNTTTLHDHEVLVSDIAPEGRGTTLSPDQNRGQLLARKAARQNAEAEKVKPEVLPPPPVERMSTHELGLPQVSQLPALPIGDDTDIGGPPLQRSFSSGSNRVLFPLLQEMRRPTVSQNCMQDPVADTFFNDVWQTVAENNTKIFRQVFRCQPDNDVKTWQQYKEYTAFSARFAESQGLGKTPARAQQGSRGKSGPPGDAVTNPLAHMEEMAEKAISSRRSKDNDKKENASKSDLPKGTVEEWAADQEKKAARNEPIFTPPADNNEKHHEGVSSRDFHDASGQGFVEVNRDADTVENISNTDIGRQRTITISEPSKEKEARTISPVEKASSGPTVESSKGSQRRRRRTTGRSTHRPFHHEDADMLLPKADAEELLKLVQGSLVVWPYDWLSDADEKGQFIYTVDALAPLEV